MKSAKRSLYRLLLVAVAFLGIVGLGILIFGQEAPTRGVPLIDDWSFHHLVFSSPGTAAEAMKNGESQQWYAITNNPRYQMQVLKRSATARALAAAPDFAARSAILNASNEHADRSPVSTAPKKQQPVKKDWSSGMGAGAAAALTVTVAAPTSGVSGTSTLLLDSVTLSASAPVAEVATISVPASAYCIPPGAGVSVGTTPTNVTTGGTVPSGGSIAVGSNGFTGETTVGAVVYTWEASLGTSGCGSTLNCVLVSASGSGTQGHENTAEALYRAIQNTGASTCSNTSATNPCYALATGQGANTGVTASYTANSTSVSLSSWKCAGTSGAVIANTASGVTLTNPTGGGVGTTSGTSHTFALPSPISNTGLATNINTGLGTIAGVASHSVSSSTITLTASTAGSTGITDSLFGSPTGITVGVTTAGSNGTASNTAFTYWSGNAAVSQSTFAGNIATTINNNPTLQTASTGVSASSNSGTTNNLVITARFGGTTGDSLTAAPGSFTAFNGGSPGTLSGGSVATVQPNVFPATYVASSSSISCANDFAVYPTGYAGSASTANIIAYNNLYSGSGGCGTSGVPAVYWAYNTGAGYAVTTSPIIASSYSGTTGDLAFIQSNGSGAQLVVLKFSTSSPGTLTAPVVPTTSTNILTCTAPCMTVTGLSNNDTYSAPYYDFALDDALFVGDDTGNLEKFTGVFLASAVTGPTSAALGSAPVASPVYDSTTGCVFVGDTSGFLYSVDAGGSYQSFTTCNSGTFEKFATSEQLGGGASEGIFDAPLVDSSAGTVYAFVAGSAAIGNCGTAGHNCVFQYLTTFTGTAATPHNEEALGTGGAGYNLYAGSFDNVYYSNSTPTGSLYSVGNTGATTGATLYRVPIASNVMSAASSAVTGLTVSGAHPWPSPLSEFCNGACTSNGTTTTAGTDYLFFSVNRGNVGGCTTTAGNGCVLSYNINNPSSVAIAGNGLNVTTPGTNGCWATGALAIDNTVSTSSGGSNIYFVNFDGAAGGGANGSSYASSICTPGAGPTLNATQASQASP